MKAKRIALAIVLACLSLGLAFSQGADPKTVKPAWVIEQEFAQQPAQKAADAFGVVFIGYDYPILSGLLAADIAPWNGPFNFSFGIESCSAGGSSFLTGFEAEMLITVNEKGSRLLMNSMMMLGYSFDLKPLRFNLGGRLGLSLLDVSDTANAANTYTGLGFVFGPETSLYLALDPSVWLWLRGRYSWAYYASIDGPASSPIASGKNALECISVEAGFAFKM